VQDKEGPYPHSHSVLIPIRSIDMFFPLTLKEEEKNWDKSFGIIGNLAVCFMYLPLSLRVSMTFGFEVLSF
jgi:hypothetical protein